MILHIPHHSTYIPDEYRDLFVISDEALAEEIQLMTDHDTDKIFGLEHPNITRVSAEVSRLLVDMERFRNDKDESMSKKGMGAVYTQRQDGTPLKIFTPEQREALLQRYYDPHHKALEEAVQKELDQYGECLIIDCHSFPNKALPYEERSKHHSHVDFCIGIENFHAPEELVIDICRYLSGFEVAINEPFTGSIVPSKFYQKDSRVKSIMIEINRDLELDYVTSFIDDLLAYLSGDKQALTSDDFDGDNSITLTKLDDWEFYEGEEYANEIYPCLSLEGEGLHESCLFQSMDVSFSSPSCKSTINLWMEVAYYFTPDKKLDSVDVNRSGCIYERATSGNSTVDGCIYDFDGSEVNKISYEEGEDEFDLYTSSDIESKLVELMYDSYQQIITNKENKNVIEERFKNLL